jgi:signal transduction histidine kinase/ActR/RegA family two-component response regulator
MASKSTVRSHQTVLVFTEKKESVPIIQNIISGLEAEIQICRNSEELCGKISDQVEAIFIIGDRDSEKAIPEIAQTLNTTVGCSALPVIVSVAGGADSPIADSALRKLRNVLALGYPFTQASLKQTLRIAFGSREMQRRLQKLENDTERGKNALSEARDQLEQEVQHRTHELTESVAQLRRLTGDLILSELRERRRLAGILHDHLQQLLVSAKYRVASLNRIEDSAVKVSVQEIEELLGEVIEASRSLTSELFPPIVHESGLRTVMEWLVSFMAAQNGLVVQLKMEDDEEAAPLDENTKVMLFESTRELLFNVIKHAQVRSAKVTICRLEGNRLEIAVSDQGIGFDPSLMDRTGVGLFRIRERLKLIGGRLEIQSSPGRGARFTILVPLPETMGQAFSSSTVPNSTLHTEPALPRHETPVSGTIRILIADDHAVMRQGLSISLSQEPDIVIVGEAVDGKMALEKTRNLRPDVVLMDLGMPQMNGIEATRRIHSEMPKVRVIGLSMFGEKERANAMFKAGAVAYLSKSCSVDTLTAAIRKCVRKSELRSS